MTAPPLVLLHGFASGPELWDLVVSRLPREPPVLRPRLPGHGVPVTEGGFLAQAARLLDDVRSFAARAGPPVLAGYSLGGRLALGMTHLDPSCARALVLVSAHPGLEDPEERRWRREDDERRALEVESRGLPAFLAGWDEGPLFSGRRVLPSEAREALRRSRSSLEPAGLAASLRTTGLGVMPRLALPALPVTLLAGSRDTRYRALVEQLAPGRRDVRRIVVPDAGHDLVLEAPEAVARALMETS